MAGPALGYWARLAAILGKSAGEDGITFIARKYNDLGVERIANILQPVPKSTLDAKTALAKYLDLGRQFQTTLNKELDTQYAAVKDGKVTQQTVFKDWSSKGYLEPATISGWDYFYFVVLAGCMNVGGDAGRASEVVLVLRNDKRIGQYLKGIAEQDLQVFVYACMRDPQAKKLSSDLMGMDVLYDATLNAGKKIYAALSGVTVTVSKN